MKPIFVVKMPSQATFQEMAQTKQHLDKHPLKEDYHWIIAAPDIDMYVLNGEELTEMSWEDFKAKYK